VIITNIYNPEAALLYIIYFIPILDFLFNLPAHVKLLVYPCVFTELYIKTVFGVHPK
jgi:hypothetical protein